MTIRSKHGNLFNYFACDHRDLSPAYLKGCEKFFNKIGKRLEKRSKSLPGSS